MTLNGWGADCRSAGLAAIAGSTPATTTRRVRMIVKVGARSYAVRDSSGKKTLGTHPNYQDALAQLRAIEISKHKRAQAGK